MQKNRRIIAVGIKIQLWWIKQNFNLWWEMSCLWSPKSKKSMVEPRSNWRMDASNKPLLKKDDIVRMVNGSRSSLLGAQLSARFTATNLSVSKRLYRIWTLILVEFYSNKTTPDPTFHARRDKNLKKLIFILSSISHIVRT